MLSHSLWTPLARLSFSVYLVHLTVLEVAYYNFMVAEYWRDFETYKGFVYIVIVSWACALPVCLSVESPTLALEKILFGHGAPPEKQAQVQGKTAQT
jgi:peptidoglycan/LPS O-acetylase OafA/YrhL